MSYPFAEKLCLGKILQWDMHGFYGKLEWNNKTNLSINPHHIFCCSGQFESKLYSTFWFPVNTSFFFQNVSCDEYIVILQFQLFQKCLFGCSNISLAYCTIIIVLDEKVSHYKQMEKYKLLLISFGPEATIKYGDQGRVD